MCCAVSCSQEFQNGKKAQGTMPLARATARVVLGVDSSSLLPRQFEVETPERNLIAKTLEGQDATVSCTVVVLISLLSLSYHSIA
eukprot:COSAG06_NODE_7202_length_2586_cov_2.638922_2_plen_85_part_00